MNTITWEFNDQLRVNKKFFNKMELPNDVISAYLDEFSHNNEFFRGSITLELKTEFEGGRPFIHVIFNWLISSKVIRDSDRYRRIKSVIKKNKGGDIILNELGLIYLNECYSSFVKGKVFGKYIKEYIEEKRYNDRDQTIRDPLIISFVVLEEENIDNPSTIFCGIYSWT